LILHAAPVEIAAFDDVETKLASAAAMSAASFEGFDSDAA
jgi:hypothetical protein